MNILLVRLRLIGDVVFTTPLLRALKRRYPTARLTYVVEPLALPLVERHRWLDEVITIPKASGLSRVAGDIAVGASLRRRRFDVAIDLHGGPRSAWLTWASGATRRIGYRTRGRTWMYTDVVERPPDNGPRHSVRNQWDLLEPLDVGECTPERDPVEIGAVSEGRLQQVLADAGITPATPVIVIHVSAGNPFRRWPAASFVELVVALAQRDPSRRVVITSGPSEAEAAARVISEARSRLGPLAASVPSLSEVDLGELHHLIARAALFIGGDSGPMHIASTTSVPIVALLGPTLPERSMPWRSSAHFAESVDAGALPCRPCRQRVCQPGDFRCLTSIPAERVVEAAERALAFGRKRNIPLESDAHDAATC